VHQYHCQPACHYIYMHQSTSKHSNAPLPRFQSWTPWYSARKRMRFFSAISFSLVDWCNRINDCIEAYRDCSLLITEYIQGIRKQCQDESAQHMLIKHCLSNSIKIKTKDTFSLPKCIMHHDASQIKITPARTSTAEQTVPSTFSEKENYHSQRIRKHSCNGIKKVYLRNTPVNR